MHAKKIADINKIFYKIEPFLRHRIAFDVDLNFVGGISYVEKQRSAVRSLRVYFPADGDFLAVFYERFGVLMDFFDEVRSGKAVGIRVNAPFDKFLTLFDAYVSLRLS